MSSPLIMEQQRQLTASQFELKMQKNEDKKETDLYNCREAHYIKLMFAIMTGFTLFGMLVYSKMSPLFMLMPIYRSDQCHYVQLYGNDDTLPKYQVTTNQIMFYLVNWMELAYIYYVWKQLKKINQDQLNIKNELMLITWSWIIFSLFYFVTLTNITE